jgi:hypothetical protein
MMFEYSRTPLFPSLSIPVFHHSNIPASKRPLWLFSRRADFWLACGGASVGLLAAFLVILWHGDRELDALDFVLSEFHLGATYGAIMQRRLWRHRSVDVLLVPFAILGLTYALSLSGQAIWLTSVAMYAAVWHRGRQSLGVARFYQRGVGGPVSRTHDCLFRGAIYLPMLAGLLAYTHLAPIEYEGEPYQALTVGREMTWFVGFAAVAWVIAYLAWILRRTRSQRLHSANEKLRLAVHPGEWWVVLAHAVAFGSGYVFGAARMSFILVLAVHHEVQYLYFTCAMARRPGNVHTVSQGRIDGVIRDPQANVSNWNGRIWQTEAGQVVFFLLWPLIGFSGAIAGSWSQLEWLRPLGMGGLLCHYWLDGRIWTRRRSRN